MSTSSGSIRKWTTKGADNSSLVLIVKDLREVYLREKDFPRFCTRVKVRIVGCMYTHRKGELLVSFLASQNNK